MLVCMGGSGSCSAAPKSEPRQTGKAAEESTASGPPFAGGSRRPGGMGEPIKCTLVASFAARQAIIMAAVLLFVLYTWIQIRRGVEKRSLTTLVADASKQAGQQAFGGAMMVVLGVLLAHHKYDSLAWYAAECAPQPSLAAERDRCASDEVCAAARWQIRSR